MCMLRNCLVWRLTTHALCDSIASHGVQVLHTVQHDLLQLDHSLGYPRHKHEKEKDGGLV